MFDAVVVRAALLGPNGCTTLPLHRPAQLDATGSRTRACSLRGS